jgi:four helix bundle protein
MIEKENSKKYDLEGRTLAFAKRVRVFARLLSKDIANIEDIRQLIRSSGSVGANYIEANESLSKKDFGMRVKICRKEAKESKYWLRLIDVDGNGELEKERDILENEAQELTYIFGSIVTKCQ